LRRLSDNRNNKKGDEMYTNPEQRAVMVAAQIYYLGKSINLKWQEINLAMRLALSELNHGKSGASAYEAGADALRLIASFHPEPGQPSPL
jgi:hypothetical protein